MSHECQNCGSHVTAQYARVRSFPNEHNPRVCPECPDKVYGSPMTGVGGAVRVTRTKRHPRRER